MSSGEAIQAAQDARLSAGLLAPLMPPALDSPATRAWKEVLAIPAGLEIAPAEPGAVLDLSGDQPRLDAS
jgi:hypothetical protein